MNRFVLSCLALGIAGIRPCAAQNPLPNSAIVDPPSGHVLAFTFQTLPHSVQIYTCKTGKDGKFTWTGPDPDAVMTNDDKTMTVHHYKGPTWEGAENSGPKATHYLAKNHDAVHWLELPAMNPTGKFANVKLIHRVNTTGGLPPSSKPCDKNHEADQERVGYSATYLFYAPKY